IGGRKRAASRGICPRRGADDAERPALQQRERLRIRQGDTALQNDKRRAQWLGPLGETEILEQRRLVAFPEEQIRRGKFRANVVGRYTLAHERLRPITPL